MHTAIAPPQGGESDNRMLLTPLAQAADEILDSGAVFAGANMCVECLVSIGLDPAYAGPAAVLTAAAARMAYAFYIARRRAPQPAVIESEARPPVPPPGT